jgi:hypothetical protein
VDDAEQESRSGSLGLDHAWSTLSLPGDSPATTPRGFLLQQQLGCWGLDPVPYRTWLHREFATEGFEPSIPVFAIARESPGHGCERAPNDDLVTIGLARAPTPVWHGCKLRRRRRQIRDHASIVNTYLASA